MTTGNTPPGWYDDPHHVEDLRYWDGTAWTEHTHARVEATTPAPVVQDEPTVAVPVSAAPGSASADASAPNGSKRGVLMAALLLIGAVGIGILVLVPGNSDPSTADGSPSGATESSPDGAPAPDQNPFSPDGSPGAEGAGKVEEVTTTSVDLTNGDYQLDGGEIVVADGMVWVTSPGAVSVLDESTGELIDSIPVSSTDAAQLSAGDGRVWLAQPDTNSLTVIDTSSRTVVGEVALPDGGYRVSEMAMLMDGYAWVPSWNAIAGQDQLPDIVTVIDTSTLSVVARMDVGGGAGSLTLVDGKVWLVSSLVNEVTAIDVASLSVEATIPAGDFPTDLVYADGAIWVANSRGATVSVIDPSSFEIVDEIVVGAAMSDSDDQHPGPRSIVASGDSLWITMTQDYSLKVIDTSSREVVDSVATFGSPIGVSGGFMWVPGGVTVTLIDVSTHEIVDESAVGDGSGMVYDLVVTEDAAWVVSDNGTVSQLAVGGR